MRNAMKSLRAKMTALIVLVVMASTGLLLLISYQRTSDIMSAQLEQNYSIIADKYAQELTAWVNTNATIIETMAAEIATDSLFDEDYETFHRYLADNCALLNTNGYLYDIYFTYPDNRMVCASDFVPDGTVNYSRDREWFTRAAGTGELFYSTPYRDSDSGKTIVTISRAVYRHNTLAGVLAADIFVDVLADIIREADVAQDSYAFLVDQNQGMIVHPNPAYAFDDVPRRVWLRFPSFEKWKEKEQSVLRTVAEHGGRDQVVIYIEDRKAKKTLPPGQGIRADDTVIGLLSGICGVRNVVLQ